MIRLNPEGTLGRAAITVVVLLGVAFVLAFSTIAADAWFNNTMGEYYDPTDAWGTMKWGYAAQLVLILTVVFFAVSAVLTAVGAALTRLFGTRVRG